MITKVTIVWDQPKTCISETNIGDAYRNINRRPRGESEPASSLASSKDMAMQYGTKRVSEVIQHNTIDYTDDFFSFSCSCSCSCASSREIWLIRSEWLTLSTKWTTHVSRLAVLHRASLASSLTLNPNIFGSNISAFSAIAEVLIPAPPSLLCPADTKLLLTSATLDPTGWPFPGIICGYTMKSMWGNVVPK